MSEPTRKELVALVERLATERDRWRRLSRLYEGRYRQTLAQLADQGIGSERKAS